MQNDWFERPNAGPGRIMEAASHQPLSPHSGLNTVLGLGIMNGQNGEIGEELTTAMNNTNT